MPCPINLEKQIKRHVIAPRHRCHAITAPGVEHLCAQELASLSDQIQVEATVKGGVVFSGRLEALYQANLFLRTAGRLLLRVAEFKATNFRQLEKRCATVPWERYLPWGALPVCKVTSHQSRLYHSQAVAQHVALALTACWRDLGVAPTDAPNQSLFVRLDQDLVTLSLDSSGANLYRRGLKTHGGQAPLRETQAAAILRMAGYDPERPLLDPMCGAGSFALEAALWAKQIPPGFHREFAFMQWPAFRPRQWQHLRTTAQKAIRSLPHPLIHASDLDPEACRRLAACVAHHHLDDAVDVQCHDFFVLQPPPARDGHPPATGLIVLNPPYGVRLTPDRRIETFYKRIGAKLADDFKGWQVALIVPSPHLIGTQPFPTTSIPLLHGGLQLTLLVGRVKH